MLRKSELEPLQEKVCALLSDVGMKIENDELKSIMLKNGCSEAPSGRVRIPKVKIDEIATCLKKTQKQDAKDQEVYLTCGVDWTHFLMWTNRLAKVRRKVGREFMMSAFDCGPTKFYDYREHKVLPVNTDIFIEMKKFAQATPEIGYISMWYRQDAPPETERIESLILAHQYCDKIDAVEAIYPVQIKYLQEIGEIVHGAGARCPYIAGSQCITSPLILERRSADEMMERKRRGVGRYHIASMPTIGVSTPVTIAGSVVMTAAEILGGMAAAFILDRGSDISGRSISLVVDMKNGNNTPAGPETTMVNIAVKELFDAFWGGHCWVEVFFSPYAKRPGMQAVCENYNGVRRYSKLTGNPDIPYPGMGTLDNGGMGSPAQFMLDMEIRKWEFSAKDRVEISGEALPFEEICETTRTDGNFLGSEHTLAHFRNLWSSPVFLTENPTPGAWEGNEKSMLDKCDEMWRENVKKFQPPRLSEDKRKALDRVLESARKELKQL